MNSEIKRKMSDIREYEAAYIIAKLVKDKHLVLNIGCSWGRDHFYLSKLGKKVINLDISEQPHLENFIQADATKLPFSDEVFDAVLLPEILEHNFYDVKVLKEARRVLKEDGFLIVTVPFFHDEKIDHVRIYSPKTICRLLNYVGFKILDYIERGGIISFANIINPILNSNFPIRRKIKIEDIAEFDYKLGKSRVIWFRRSKYYGCYIRARKEKS